MLYLYDNKICEDLRLSFNSDNVDDVVVKVVEPENIVGLAAQIKEDKVTFPIVAVSRDPDTPIDSDRINFTRSHFGVATVFDKETNNIYYEKVIPIKLSYKMTLLTTNTVDMDELVKEMLFKYLQMYFLTIKLPYECNRKIRFGIKIDPDSEISRQSGNVEYIQQGKLYQTVIQLRCEGAVLVSYTPQHLKRLSTEIEPVDNLD